MKYESEFDNDEIDRIQAEFKRMKGTSAFCGSVDCLLWNKTDLTRISYEFWPLSGYRSLSMWFIYVESHVITVVFFTDIHYVDHAGATQYSEKQMQQICAHLTSSIYCNPHTSKATEDLVDQVRYKVLSHFNTTTDDYSVVFTSGTTASLKLVAETFNFDATGSFVYLRDNHTSVLGMREVVQTTHTKCLERNELFANRCVDDVPANSLFVFPAQCNFNGFKYPLELISRLQGTSNFVCLDAASFVATNYLDLKKYRPDFVCISFYKIFGYPSGLGALLVSKRGEPMLQKRYYGGGTVKISLSDASGWHQKRDCLHER